MNYNQKTMLIAAIITVLIMTIISGCMETKQKDDMQNNHLQDTTQGINTTGSKPVSKDTTIKVVKFEPNNPCQGCTNLGNFAEETIQIHFPEDYKSGNFVICVYGQDDIVNELQMLAKTKKVLNQPIEIKVINNITSIPKCNILFISSKYSNKITEISKSLGT